MDGERILLELEANTRRVLRRARVLGQSGAMYNVEWNSGAREDVRLGHREGKQYVAVPAGSLRYRMLTDPEDVVHAFDRGPAEVFLAALREFDKAVTSRQLIDRVRQELPSRDVSEAWTAAKSEFEASPEVAVTGAGRQRTYLRALSSKPVSEAIAAGQSFTIVSGRSSREEAHPQDDEPAHTTDGAVESEAPLLRLVHEAAERGHVGVEWADLADAQQRVLESGVILGEQSEQLLKAAVPHLGRAACLLAAVPRRSKAADSVDVLKTLGPVGLTALLRSAADEIRTARQSPAGSATTDVAFEHLLRRALSASGVRCLPLDVLLQVTSLVRVDGDLEKRDWVANIVAEWLIGQADLHWASLASGVQSDIRRRLTAAPLRAGSGRSRALMWLWNNDRSVVVDRSWWAGVSVDDLIESAGGRLARVLEDPVVAADVVKPLVSSALAETTTRRRLMTILGSHSAIAGVAVPDQISSTLVRVLQSDAAARSWTAAITSTPEIERLTAKVAALEEKRAGDAVALRQAVDAASHEAARREDVEARLRHADEQVSGLRDAQVRQVRLDVLKSMADLAAFVADAVGSQEPQRIRERVTAKLAREGMTPIGAVGEVVPYQPRLHDLVGEAIDPEMPVRVRGLGYRLLVDGEDDVVLCRALVERTE